MDGKKIKKHIYGGAVMRFGACLEKFLNDEVPGEDTIRDKIKRFAGKHTHLVQQTIIGLMNDIWDARNKGGHHESGDKPASPVFDYEEFYEIRQKGIRLDRLLRVGGGRAPGMSQVMLLSSDEQIYTMGNAGDFIKHGVLIQTLNWLNSQEVKIAYADPFGGNPWAELNNETIKRRLKECPRLVHAWDDNAEKYYGSGYIAREKFANVYVSDKDMLRRGDLESCGFKLLDKKFPGKYNNQNGYCILRPEFARNFNLILIDPLGDFLTQYLDELDNVLAAVQRDPRLFVIVFVLDWWRNSAPADGSGRYRTHCNFMKRRQILDGVAYSLRCPMIENKHGIKGESKYEMEVLLVSEQIADGKCAALREELSDFAEEATKILRLPKDKRVKFSAIGEKE